MHHEGGLSFHQLVNCARLVTHAKCVKLIEVLLRQLSVRMHMYTHLRGWLTSTTYNIPCWSLSHAKEIIFNRSSHGRGEIFNHVGVTVKALA
jgi:hypothetical protein